MLSKFNGIIVFLIKNKFIKPHPLSETGVGHNSRAVVQ